MRQVRHGSASVSYTHLTCDLRPVDLYYDGEYRGSYVLIEKIQVDKGRVDISDLEDAIDLANPGADIETFPSLKAKNKYGNVIQYVAGVKDPANIEGGYLLELDPTYYAEEASWFSVTWPGKRYTCLLYTSRAIHRAHSRMRRTPIGAHSPKTCSSPRKTSPSTA